MVTTSPAFCPRSRIRAQPARFCPKSNVQTPARTGRTAAGFSSRAITAGGNADAASRPAGAGTIAAGSGARARSGAPGGGRPITSPSRMQSNPRGLATCRQVSLLVTSSRVPSS
jgi:hypothetical protein